MLPRDLLKSIKEDHVHGATELALIAIDGLREIVEQDGNADLDDFTKGISIC